MIGGIIILLTIAVVAGLCLGAGIFLSDESGWIVGFILIGSLVLAIFSISISPPPPMSSSKGWEIDTVYTIKNGEKIGVEYIVKEKKVKE